MTVQLYLGDCIDVLKTLPDNSVDAVVTDPPYGLGFMGKNWDTFDNNQLGIACEEGANDLKVKKNFKILPRYGNSKDLYSFSLEWSREVLRVLKPGGHLLSFGGTRTYHRMACAIEDAGFEIRDQIQWIYGSGFPKSMNIGIQVDKMAGAEREVGEPLPYTNQDIRNNNYDRQDGVNNRIQNYKTFPSTPEAEQWEGWGTALKPANEPIVLARKPIEEKTVASNVLKWRTGGINIDGCRVGTEEHTVHGKEAGKFQPTGGKTIKDYHSISGRFPANVIMDDEAGAILDDQSGNAGACSRASGPTAGKLGRHGIYSGAIGEDWEDGSKSVFYADKGGASRFFYCAKASKSERDRGLGEMQEKKIVTFATCNGTSGKPSSISEGRETAYRNNHPTVKPVALMRYLCRLITPPGGIVLDPFTGSGTTGIASVLEGFNFIGIEKDNGYIEIAEKRIADAQKQMRIEFTVEKELDYAK